jgi:hypothetical protein
VGRQRFHYEGTAISKITEFFRSGDDKETFAPIIRGMARPYSTCQHLKRVEIDRGLAAGEPSKQIARDYALNPSGLHRHRGNCIGLASSTHVMKETARSTAALACLPSKEDLGNAYFELRSRIDRIVDQARRAVPRQYFSHRAQSLSIR